MTCGVKQSSYSLKCIFTIKGPCAGLRRPHPSAWTFITRAHINKEKEYLFSIAAIIFLGTGVAAL